MSKPLLGRNKIEKKGTLIDIKKIKLLCDVDDVFYSNEFLELFNGVCYNKDTDMIEYFMNLPALIEMQYPIELSRIQQHQVHNPHLLARQQQRPDLYLIQYMADGVLLFNLPT